MGLIRIAFFNCIDAEALGYGLETISDEEKNTIRRDEMIKVAQSTGFQTGGFDWDDQDKCLGFYTYAYVNFLHEPTYQRFGANDLASGLTLTH